MRLRYWILIIAALYAVVILTAKSPDELAGNYSALGNPQLLYAKQLWRDLPQACRGDVELAAEKMLAANPSCFYKIAELGQRYCDVRKT